ncbi:MAG: isoprenylcysteine carboxylmethyltransferase family protein [Chloroflexi bacterium]|nr:isoprenylcysteine carboxylmethyltransferase family protein [Chloroflexota bacterium]
MVQIAIFIIATAGIAAYSLPSLRDPRSHGFFRFFAFESILALILLNVAHWFDDPFSARQIVSWLMLIASGFLALHGFYLLRVIGKPRGNIENTTTLVRRGAYRYVRHPLYSSLLWLAWGAFLKDVSPISIALVAVATLALFATAKAEEAENFAKFGATYAEYMKSTRRFVPLLF